MSIFRRHKTRNGRLTAVKHPSEPARLGMSRLNDTFNVILGTLVAEVPSTFLNSNMTSRNPDAQSRNDCTETRSFPRASDSEDV